MTDNIVRNQDLGIPGNGGSFAPHNKSDADPSVILAEPTNGDVRVGPYTVQAGSLEPLPEWPAGIVRPDVHPQYNDSDGQISVSVQVGPVWLNTFEIDSDVHLDDFDDAGAPTAWTDEDRAQITEFAQAAHQRAKQVLGQVEYQATHSEALSPALHALVNDEPVPATPQASLTAEDADEASRILDKLEAANRVWSEATNEGLEEDGRAYEAREDAELTFANDAYELLKRLLGR
ncbi:hypothetical protein ACWGJ9_10680 [Curtobacterium citreum]